MFLSAYRYSESVVAHQPKVPRNLGASKKFHALGFGPTLGASNLSMWQSANQDVADMLRSMALMFAKHFLVRNLCEKKFTWQFLRRGHDALTTQRRWQPWNSGGAQISQLMPAWRKYWHATQTITLLTTRRSESTLNALWHINVAANMRLQQIVRPNWSIWMNWWQKCDQHI